MENELDWTVLRTAELVERGVEHDRAIGIAMAEARSKFHRPKRWDAPRKPLKATLGELVKVSVARAKR